MDINSFDMVFAANLADVGSWIVWVLTVIWGS
jgi:hypothetical protein